MRADAPALRPAPLACLLALCCLLAAGRCGASGQHAHHLVGRGHQRAATGGSWSHRIPSLLHYVFLGGFDAFQAQTAGADSPMNRTRFERCQAIHRHWDSMFWDERMAEQLVREHYPAFLPVWQGFEHEAQRNDAARVMIMHHHGGLYLDLDVECYRPADGSVEGQDVVLQGGGDEGFHNSIMASAPGHELWVYYMKLMEERAHLEWEAAYSTGTDVLTRAVLDTIVADPPGPVSGYLGGIFPHKGTSIRIFPMGEWYVPCYGLDLICTRQYERGLAEGSWNMTNLYGRHYYDEVASPAIIAEMLRTKVVE